MKTKILIFVYLTFVFFMTALMIFALQEQPKPEPQKIKSWKLPIYMQENLQWMLNDFNKKFDEKVEAYKKELKTRFEEFKDMPDDVVLYLEGGIFIKSSDYLKLQEEAKKKMEEQIKKEVKKNEKTTT